MAYRGLYLASFDAAKHNHISSRINWSFLFQSLVEYLGAHYFVCSISVCYLNVNLSKIVRFSNIITGPTFPCFVGGIQIELDIAWGYSARLFRISNNLVLAFSYSKHLGATCGTNTLGCRLAILHGDSLAILHFPFSATFHTVCLH